MLLKQQILRAKTTKAKGRGSQLNDAQRTIRTRLRDHQLLSSNQTRVSRSSLRVVRLKMARALQSLSRITTITRITRVPKMMMK